MVVGGTYINEVSTFGLWKPDYLFTKTPQNTIQQNAKMLNTKDYNALSLAQPTNFKAMLHSGELLWGTGCRIAHPEAARVVAATPYHFCFLDAVSINSGRKLL